MAIVDELNDKIFLVNHEELSQLLASIRNARSCYTVGSVFIIGSLFQLPLLFMGRSIIHAILVGLLFSLGVFLFLLRKMYTNRGNNIINIIETRAKVNAV